MLEPREQVGAAALPHPWGPSSRQEVLMVFTGSLRPKVEEAHKVKQVGQSNLRNGNVRTLEKSELMRAALPAEPVSQHCETEAGEARGSGVQGHCWFHLNIKASLGYLRLCLKKTQNRVCD